MITVFFSCFFFFHRRGDHVMALLGGEYKNFVILPIRRISVFEVRVTKSPR